MKKSQPKHEEPPQPQPTPSASYQGPLTGLSKAAKEKLQAKWGPEKRRGSVDALMAGMLKERTDASDDPTLVDVPLIGFPIPLALQYLIGMSVWPLNGLMVGFFGTYKAGKTCFTDEICRLAIEYDGMGFISDCEGKKNLENTRAILRRPPGEPIYNPRMQEADTAQAWQKQLHDNQQFIKEAMTGTKAEPGPGRIMPVVFVVDGFCSVSDEGLVDDFQKNGTISRVFPVDSLVTKNWSKVHRAAGNRDWPISVVMVGHLKLQKGQPPFQPDKYYAPGAQTIHAAASVRINMINYDDGRVRDAADYRYIEGDLISEAGTYTHAGRVVPYRIYIRDTVEKGHEMGFDWEWSFIEAMRLLDWKGAKESDGSAKKPSARRALVLDQILGIEFVSSKSNPNGTCWATSVGHADAGDAVPFAEMTRLIERDPVLLKRLRAALGITERPVLAGDFLMQRKALEDADAGKA